MNQIWVTMILEVSSAPQFSNFIFFIKPIFLTLRQVPLCSPSWSWTCDPSASTSVGPKSSHSSLFLKNRARTGYAAWPRPWGRGQGAEHTGHLRVKHPGRGDLWRKSPQGPQPNSSQAPGDFCTVRNTGRNTNWEDQELSRDFSSCGCWDNNGWGSQL